VEPIAEPSTRTGTAESIRGKAAPIFAFIASLALCGALLFGHLGRPLLWHDEAHMAAYGESVLEYGYPNALGEPSLRYSVRETGLDPETGAYRDELWAPYYVAALGALLASAQDDLYARTARIRLPFTLLGCVGIATVCLGVLPCIGDARTRRWWFSIGFTLATATSISLLLHLREARYYGLALCLVAILVVLHARRHIMGRGAPLLHAAATALAAFLLFNTFFPAFASVLAALGTQLLFTALREPGPWQDRIRRLASGALPLVLGASAAIPVALAFDMQELVGVRFEEASRSARSYVENLAFVVPGLLRYEFLGVALAARLGVLALRTSGTRPSSRQQVRLKVSGLLLWVSFIHVIVVCRMPLVWERYLIMTSPLITAAALLDGLTLVELARGASLRLRAPLLAVFAICGAAALLVRAPEMSGRFAELRTPPQGPLDHIIPYLADRYPDPGRLVVATNYEGPAYTWYLGCRVLLGYFGGNLAEDRLVVPDVIIPRPWPRHLRVLRGWLESGEYEPVYFPVRAVRTNHNPSLWRGSPGGVRHRSYTPLPRRPRDRSFLFERHSSARD
jgi:hypothetical protein